MKRKIGLFLCLTLALGSAASAAELLWNNFDAAPTGSVANLPGWTRSPWYPTQTGRVVNINYSHSPSNILELQWATNGSSAAFTNFSTTYTTAQHPVIRFSANLLSANSNIFFRIGLRNSNTLAFLSFQTTNGQGVVGFQNRNLVSVPLVTDHFVDLSVLYNRSNGQIRLDYDYTNRLTWTNSDVYPTIHTQFNQFGVIRHHIPTNPSDQLLIDDVRVETFPPYVWAWWRCSDPSTHFIEQLGAFKPTTRDYFPYVVRAGSSDPVWDGQGDFHNVGAVCQLRASPGDAALPLPAVTNWTFETALRMSPAAGNTTFFDWGTNTGFNATSAWLNIGYNSNGYVYANLRDSQQGDSTYINLALRNFTPNGRWQHLAVVKSNAQLSLYVDYQPVTNRTLTATGDGSYGFPLLSRAAIGVALNGGYPAGEDTVIDEVRFSTKALALSEFLQPGQPLIVDIVNHPTNTTWELTMKGILGKSYRVETSPSIGPDAAWQYATNLVADYTFNYVDVPDTVPRTNFVRIIRVN